MIITIVALQYLFMLNVMTFGLFAWDKHLAVYEKKRIPEWLLMFLAAIGGAFGALNAMALFRHKTKHAKFNICIPLFLLVHVIIFMIIRFL